jgi:hypothetical protein
MMSSRIQFVKNFLRGNMTSICEDVMVWSASRDWNPIIKIHDSFVVKTSIPTQLPTNQTLHKRFLTQADLGFSAQFLLRILNVTILGQIGFILLDEGAFLAQGNWRVMNVVAHPLLKRRSAIKNHQYLGGNWYSIRSYYSNSYHHWFWDDIPRLLTALPHLPNDIQFIVGEPFQEFQRQSLEKLGIEASKIKVQHKDQNLKIEHLWFATPLGHSEYAATAPDVAQQLQAIFNPKPHPSPYRKIYISRSLARYRRIVNESELIPILENLGFEIVHTEKLSFASQVKLFNEAKVILSSHGAGLTNMLFAPSPALVLELFEPRAGRSHYWMMAHALGHNYDCLIGETVATGKVKVDPDFTISKQRFSDFVSKYLSNI